MDDFKIGKLLRIERKKLGLTGEKFVKGVMSVSQYSRVENGEQDLKVANLLKILSKNQLNIEQFIREVVLQSELDCPLPEDEVLNIIAQNFYNQNLPRLKQLKSELKRGSYNQTLVLRLELIIAVLEDNVANISRETQKKLSVELNKSDDWVHDKNFLQLFGSTMVIFNVERLGIYMKKIISAYQDSLHKQTFIIQRRIAGICVNYLTNCYHKQIKLHVKDTLRLLNNIANDPDLLMYRLLGVYFQALFAKDDIRMAEIRKLLTVAGYSDFTMNLP